MNYIIRKIRVLQNRVNLKVKPLFTSQWFKQFLIIFLTIIIIVPLTLGIAKATHWFDGKDGHNGKDASTDIPYIDNPTNDTTIELINKFLWKLETPSEENIHLTTARIPDPGVPKDDNPKYWNNGKYLERPEDVWNGNHKNEPWYLSEIWWPNDNDYDFQIKNFYLNSFQTILKEINEFLSVYQIRVNGKFQTQKNSPQYQENPTNIDLTVSNRSVYGLTINAVAFQLQVKIPKIKDEWSEAKKFEIKYPKAIAVKKEVLTDFVDQTSKSEDEDDNAFAPYFAYDLMGNNSFHQILKHSNLDIRTKNLGFISSFDNDKIQEKFLVHAKNYHSFNLIPDKNHKGVDMDYIFMFNYHDIQINKNQQFNHGFYLITKIHCNHDKNNGESNPNRSDGRWIR